MVEVTVCQVQCPSIGTPWEISLVISAILAISIGIGIWILSDKLSG